MYIGDIETFEDAIAYAEELYRNARHDKYAAWDKMEDAVDDFIDGREGADVKTIKRLKRKVRLANRTFKNAKEREDYTRAYLQGVRDMADALS